MSAETSKGSNWASQSITTWERVCQWEKHSWLYIALPATQCFGLSQWKSAGWGPRPEHLQTAEELAVRLPVLLAFRYSFIIFVCQSSVRSKGGPKGYRNHFRTIVFSVHNTREAGVCKHKEEDSNTCCASVFLCHPKQTTWCHSPGCQPSKEPKQTKLKPTD